MSSSISDMKRAFYLGMLGLPNTDTHDIDYLEQQFFTQYPTGFGLKSTILAAGSGQTISNSATVLWNSAQNDTLGLAANNYNNSTGVITIPSSLNNKILFLSTAVDLNGVVGGGTFALSVVRNGGDAFDDVRITSSNVHVGISICGALKVSTGDTLKVNSYAAPATTIGTVNFFPQFSIVQIG
jgi:hypothetical protein